MKIKYNILSLGIFLKSVLFIDTILCTDFSWYSNFRYRLKNDTSEDVIKNTISSSSELRTRLGLKIIKNNAMGHFVLQDSRTLGEPKNNSGITGETLPVFFHQAYFNLKLNKYNLTIGRFELAFGNQRIIAKNNWNNVGRSFEGVLLKGHYEILDLYYHAFSLPLHEQISNYHDNSKDNWLSGLYLSKYFTTNPGNKLSTEAYYMFSQDSTEKYSYNMFGSRMEMNWNALLVESEFAFQLNDSINANLFSINFGFRTKKHQFFNSITVGFEQVSGDDTTTLDKEEGFSKYFGARHKHHGFYDYKEHKKYFGHLHDGLNEINVKTNMDILKRTNLLVALHNFRSAVKNIHYGNEVDFIFKTKHNDEVSSEIGSIFYFPDQGNKKTLPFFYLMITANF
tara:strand:+ start:2348 stop:3535 length:1188 start_codon:yes stop_codon:yes gene_type:complete